MTLNLVLIQGNLNMLYVYMNYKRSNDPNKFKKELMIQKIFLV
jgi:hypothetical protein